MSSGSEIACGRRKQARKVRSDDVDHSPGKSRDTDFHAQTTSSDRFPSPSVLWVKDVNSTSIHADICRFVLSVLKLG